MSMGSQKTANRMDGNRLEGLGAISLTARTVR